MAHHGISFTTTSLSVGKNTNIITIEGVPDHIQTQILENLTLTSEMSILSIVGPKNEKLRQIDLYNNWKYFLTLFSYQYEWSKVNLCGIDLSLESTASGFDRVGVADVDGVAGSKCTWLPWTLTTNLLFKLFSLQNFKCKYSLFFCRWLGRVFLFADQWFRKSKLNLCGTKSFVKSIIHDLRIIKLKSFEICFHIN